MLTDVQIVCVCVLGIVDKTFGNVVYQYIPPYYIYVLMLVSLPVTHVGLFNPEASSMSQITDAWDLAVKLNNRSQGHLAFVGRYPKNLHSNAFTYCQTHHKVLLSPDVAT